MEAKKSLEDIIDNITDLQDMIKQLYHKAMGIYDDIDDICESKHVFMSYDMPLPDSIYKLGLCFRALNEANEHAFSSVEDMKEYKKKKNVPTKNRSI